MDIKNTEVKTFNLWMCAPSGLFDHIRKSISTKGNIKLGVLINFSPAGGSERRGNVPIPWGVGKHITFLVMSKFWKTADGQKASPLSLRKWHIRQGMCRGVLHHGRGDLRIPSKSWISWLWNSVKWQEYQINPRALVQPLFGSSVERRYEFRTRSG